jgi:penicillin-binding protein 1C
VGVWAGNADGAGRPDLTGLSTAAPVLFDIYYQLPPTTWFEMPETAIQRIPVCASSGYRPGPFCQTVAETFAPYGIEAGTTCPFCRPIHLDPTRTWRVNWSCGQFDEQPVMNWFVLPPVAESYYMKKHPEYQPLPPLQPGCTDEEELPFSLIHPVPGSTILVPVELGGEQGKTVLKAAHRRRDAILYWHLDDRFIGRTTETHELAVSPAPGEHRLTLFDDRGMMLQQDVQIVSSAPKN